MSGRNDISLYTEMDGELVSHFSLYEFENSEGLAMVHPSVLVSLELVRRDLCERFRTEVSVRVTDAIRTQQDLERLAQRLGWTDEGGNVSRNSKHLARFGGIAVDIVAQRKSNRTAINQGAIGAMCRRHFDWVKDDYADGHVHADNRTQSV